ncbi:rifin [Plasmodium sp. gorilla clade G1]|nr:rifin [Plasmodium sp. gorilla clade G1]
MHYSEILFFSLSLNILITPSYAHNKNKSYITPHTPTNTSRVLSECNLYMPNYNNDADMKSVKENFDRQTSQRFEEYEERMQEKRRKCKEQCDKDIQEIILKDKMDKSLAEKVEIGCLRCGCGLGGVAAGVGLFGGLGIYGWKRAALATAIAEGAAKGAVTGEAARIPAAIDAVISGITKEFGVSTLGVQRLESFIDVENYMKVSVISEKVYSHYSTTCITFGPGAEPSNPICTLMAKKLKLAREIPEMLQGRAVSHMKVINKTLETIVSDAHNAAGEAVERATEEAIKTSTLAVESTYDICQTAIITSVVALLIIVLVMIIIYLVLRYRRKKKMNKKAQYTKLLNQ